MARRTTAEAVAATVGPSFVNGPGSATGTGYPSSEPGPTSGTGYPGTRVPVVGPGSDVRTRVPGKYTTTRSRKISRVADDFSLAAENAPVFAVVSV